MTVKQAGLNKFFRIFQGNSTKKNGSKIDDQIASHFRQEIYLQYHSKFESRIGYSKGLVRSGARELAALISGGNA